MLEDRCLLSTGGLAQLPATQLLVSAAVSPTIAISNLTLPGGTQGTKIFPFPVTLSGSNTQGVTVNYATADGTAIAGTDYVATSGTVFWERW